MLPYRPAVILLVEDNPDHAMLTQRALRSGHALTEVTWVKDGEEALDFLQRRGRYGEPTPAPRPDLVLLDIELPKVNGRDVLARIKGDEELRTIPVIMLTTSEQPSDVRNCYRTGANSFVTKPVKFAEFLEKVSALKLYWLLVNTRPV